MIVHNFDVDQEYQTQMDRRGVGGGALDTKQDLADHIEKLKKLTSSFLVNISKLCKMS